MGEQLWVYLNNSANKAYWMYVGVWISFYDKNFDIELSKGKCEKAGKRNFCSCDLASFEELKFIKRISFMSIIINLQQHYTKAKV